MRLCVSFEEIDSALKVQFAQTECTFRADFGEVIFIKTDDTYVGDYDVIPRVYQQILETKDKLMLDDVTVEEIPIQTVINLSNGFTATIG